MGAVGCVLALLLVAAMPSPTLMLQNDGTLFLYETSAPAVLERSTADLSRYGAVDDRLPVRRVDLPGVKGDLIDGDVADNTTYYYRLALDGAFSPVCSVTTPNRPVPPLTAPSILIDKVNYYLELRDGGVPVKRYPFSMGKRCGRKVCLDRASTPEGRFRITGIQFESNYYAAYDLDYPTAVDKARYAFYKKHDLLPEPGRPIGGDIQIHGSGDWYEWNWNLNSNWTWGCVGLRDFDLDELLAQEQIGPGTPVTIVGTEITREDLAAIDQCDRAAVARALQRELGEGARCDSEWLGRYQLRKGLPVTCQADARTQKLLGVLKP